MEQTQTPSQKVPIFRRISPTVFIAAGLFIAIGAIAAAMILIKKPVELTYDGATCVPHLSVSPGLIDTRTSDQVAISFADELRVGEVGVLAFTVCFTPLNLAAESVTTVPLRVAQTRIPVKQFELTLPAAPTASTVDFVGRTIPTGRPLEIALSEPDSISKYDFTVGDSVVPCAHDNSRLACPLADLGLEQGAEYRAELIRKLGSAIEVVAEGSFTTLTPLSLVSATIAENEEIYDTRQELEMTFDTALSRAEVVLEQIDGATRTRVDARSVVDGASLTITSTEPLQRRATFAVTVVSAEGENGALLAEPLVRTFRTSGGPTVNGASVGASSAPVTGSIVFTFDQVLANGTQAASLVSVSGATASVSASGNRLTVTYSAGTCQAIAVSMKPGFSSESGVTQDQSYSFTTRTRCYTTSVIGTSERGRAIIAYSFGSGSKRLLFHGALHGNERNTKGLMDAWIAELDANPGSIPAGTQIVVIPLVNPDGYAANTRVNGRNVDLNRNFDTTDWKTDVQTVQGDPFPGGGGSAPESEAESRALANYTRLYSPTLTLSYHSVAGYVIANTCGDSGSLASRYAALTGYRNQTGVSGAFSYEITGTYDDWMCQRLSLKSILIELATSSSTEFTRNRAAMWEMVRS